MLRFNTYCSLIVLLMISSLSCSAKGGISLKAEGYALSSAQSQDSKDWAEYAFEKLQKHTENKSIIELSNNGVPGNYKVFYFEVNSKLESDYYISHSIDTLHISIRDKQIKEWMLNQLLEALGQEDNRFDVSSFPPSTVQFKTSPINFDFSYRDPHYQSNLIPGNSQIFGNNNVDLDWGIWGHNLTKVLKEIEDTNIYALVDGVRNSKQFSFTSSELLEHVTNHILNEFGEGDEKAYHFMIMPQDNDLVCICSSCLEVGNTKNNATPAVTFFIQKISERFPKHKFFTSSYNTTQQVPKNKLNENTGVFLSTIDLEKGIELNENQTKTAQFIKELDKWKTITPNIYIWDYSANFDDYLTPIPVLYSLQKQLQFYKKHGIKGIFLNASGYDYSTFDDLKSFVASALMKNTEENVDELCQSYFKKYYPQNHELLTSYYLSLEREFEEKNKPYNIYGGIDEVISSYIDVDSFIQFYKELGNVISKTKGDEKENLLKLYTALSYTKLQIAYNKRTGPAGCAEESKTSLIINPEIKKTLKQLKHFSNYNDLTNYKEAEGSLNEYVNIWERIIKNERFENLIIDKTIHILSNIDEGFEDVIYLNDGLPGFETDYHKGWHISSADLELEFSVKDLTGIKKVNLRFLNNKRHSFYPPEKIELWLDNKLVISKYLSEYDQNLNAIEIHMAADYTAVENMKLKFIRKPIKKSKIACDEIRILN